ncbi:hypothetical protein K431DRAFT_288016 [Polychaeton citri CBS 116435]|uniref:Uncharacterized protein n=1 Tax=Polychaeton citri CBS 116435 TaxID=1314669 RepID=A0A9P4UML1_9PEZI|nr:hypothetical protein K431DRAFT_288016 [Polychaeton citri CBS 116435]
MAIYQLNRRKGHKFFMSAAVFGFCMSRVVTCILRIALATRPHNARLAIAANIFTSAGVLVLYIVVQILAQRLLKATHPQLGWSRPFKTISTVLYAVVPVALVLVIVFTIISFYTLNPTLRSVALWVQRGSILYLLIFNVVSVGIFLLSLLLPRSQDRRDFGTGSVTSKRIILALAIFFIVFTAGFRAGTVWAAPRPASDPAWYDTKSAFYVIELGFEIIIVYLLLLTRFDHRFWVPNGSKRPGDYHQLTDLVAVKDSFYEKA